MSNQQLAELSTGDPIPELKVTPDKYLPHRYAGASGDFNPIHLDPEFARAVGLPQNILHGLYSMGLVARALSDIDGGDPRSLKKLAVQFRGIAVPEAEIVVSGQVVERKAELLTVSVEASQDGKKIIRNARAELQA